jgi:antitoxin (DNA-binding transcriptional repressor) of toxin-antitoxin stability system
MNRVTRTVSAREANQQFSQLLAAVERGEQVTITKHGKPVAALSQTHADVTQRERLRLAALERLADRARKGIPLTGGRYDRDDMHSRW